MKAFVGLIISVLLLFATEDTKTQVSQDSTSVMATQASALQESGSVENQEAVSESVDDSGIVDDSSDVSADEVASTTQQDEAKEYVIQNSPILDKSSIITITATGVGVVPSNTISAAQGIALANRAAIVDAYRQMGEKMHGVHLTAEDTIKNMVLQSSTIRAKVASIVKNAEVIDSTFSNGLYQVTMQVKLDGKIWHNYLDRL